MIKKTALVMVGLLVAASAAGQTIVKTAFGGSDVNLVVPKGHCVIPREDPLGALHYKLQEDGNKGRNLVALLFASCDEWAQRKANPALLLQHHGNYLFQLTQGEERLLPAAATRADLVQIYINYEMQTSVGTKRNEDLTRRLKEKLAQSSVPSPSLQGNLNPGLIDHDNMAAYLGVGGSFVYEGRPVRFIGVTAATTTRRASLTINLYGPSGSRSPFQELLTQQKDLVRSFVTANEQ